MKVSVIGAGYVGLVTSTCLAELGHEVLCMDIDEKRISQLALGYVPVYEPGLDRMVAAHLGSHLCFTADLRQAVVFGDIILICVGTPPLEDGQPDLRGIYECSAEIAGCLDHYKLIVIKSTVPPGTARKVHELISQELNISGIDAEFDVASNPEFLREGTAIQDFMNPDRILIGASNPRSMGLLKELYNCGRFEGIPVVETTTDTAEMTKYACNCFLAVKLSFINEIAELCERCQADVRDVASVMGLDERIGPHFLNPGPGFGGSCLPKDTLALVNIGLRAGYMPRLVNAAIYINSRQAAKLAAKIYRAAGGLKGKTVTVLGLSFKPGTDDIRNSPAVEIVKKLLHYGAKVQAYDPKAMQNTAKLLPGENIFMYSDVYAACKASHCIVLATDWEELCSLDLKKLGKLVENPVLFDLRNAYDPLHVKENGFKYYGVGRR